LPDSIVRVNSVNGQLKRLIWQRTKLVMEDNCYLGIVQLNDVVEPCFLTIYL